MLNSLHIEGESWLHRMGTGWKLFALLVISLVLTLISNLPVLAAALVTSLLVSRSIGMTERMLWQRTKPVLLTIAFLALVNMVLLSPREGLAILLRLPAILLFASAVTASTSLSAFIDTLSQAAMPLERLGLIRAADLGLALGLVLRFVPEIHARYGALKDAHQARGIPVKLHRLLAPLIISTLKDADSIADAIDARGIRGQKRRH
jgi:biotin transport system permease protein